MKLIKIVNDRLGHVILDYGEGGVLSLLWNPMSHSDNYNRTVASIDGLDSMESKEVSDNIMKMFEQPQESTTIEIMGRGSKIEKAISDRGWDNPTWMTPLEELLDLLIELRSL